MKNTDMNVWSYYLKIDGYKYYESDFPAISEDYSFEENGYYYFLYAYTNDRKISKEFEANRDMKKFKKVCYDGIEGLDIWVILNDMYPDHLLEYFEFETQTIDKYDMMMCDMITILCTNREYEYTMGESEILMQSKFTIDFVNLIKKDKVINMENLSEWLNDFVKIFKSEIRESFEILDIIQIVLSYMGMDDNIEGPPFLLYDEDKLAIFCSMFSNTFKPKKDLKGEVR